MSTPITLDEFDHRLLELLQHFSPGRTPGLPDFLISTLGACAGAGTILLLRHWAGIRRR